MRANAQRHDRPAEYRWRPLFNANKVWLTPATRMPCSNAAKTRNKLNLETVSIAEPLQNREGEGKEGRATGGKEDEGKHGGDGRRAKERKEGGRGETGR